MHPNAVIAWNLVKKELGTCVLFVVPQGYCFQVQREAQTPLMHIEPFECPEPELVLKNIKEILSPKKAGTKPKGKSSGRGKTKTKGKAKTKETNNKS